MLADTRTRHPDNRAALVADQVYGFGHTRPPMRFLQTRMVTGRKELKVIDQPGRIVSVFRIIGAHVGLVRIESIGDNR